MHGIGLVHSLAVPEQFPAFHAEGVSGHPDQPLHHFETLLLD
jgi:hypothetical protein